MPKTALTYQYVKFPREGRTPVEIFRHFTGKKFLLESTYSSDEKGKFSFLGMEPYEEILGNLGETIVQDNISANRTMKKMHFMDYMKKELPSIETHLSIPFFAGAVGYVGYEAIRDLMDIGKPLPDDLKLPTSHFMLFKDVIVFDHKEDCIYLMAVNPDGATEAELNQRIKKLESLVKQEASATEPELDSVQFQPEETEASFIEKVRLAKEHISRGEVLQVVLSQRMKAKIPDQKHFPLAFYKKLREENPSPYMFYLDFEDYILLGASPESLVHTRGREVTTNPIAGTRPRGKSKEEDARLEEELLADEKELHEHRMLVDLSKSDLARVCEKDSIHVTSDMTIEKYRNVMHIVSEVKGMLREGSSAIDALIACLPAGTVSGAPKQRAMQIINDLEEKMRGPYGGGVGYIGFNGDLDLTLAIRSLLVKENTAYLQAGAGIVQDSIPKKEYEETLHKARALLHVARSAQPIIREENEQ